MPGKKKSRQSAPLTINGDAVKAPLNHSPEKVSLYVGIGASAGGLEAIQTFFQNMPSDSTLTFIVIQHLSPDYKSLMVELLSKKTTIPVYRAVDGMIVESNSIYLIPPKKNLKIFHGKLILIEQEQTRGINLPIDIFFRSLAEDQGEKSAGIILSGTGSDGMRGVRAIKEQGGVVMVQDEKTAKFDGMPRSAVSTGLADFILSPEDMPEQLISYVKHPYMSKEARHERLIEDEGGLARVLALLRERFKVDFTFYKPATVNRRIERRMSFNQIFDIKEYADFALRNPSEISTLYRELLIGVTNFFRDPQAYDALIKQWLPELLNDPGKHEFRFWIAGCSTGEEAYSIAITARECLTQLNITKDIKIFATDIDRDAIAKAGAGVYPESIAADISPALLSKYFYKKDENFHIVRSIREMVVFAQHNLIKDPPFTNIDLITCRNLLIYLQPVLQKKVFNLFNFSLGHGGLLILGLSETIGDMSGLFETLDKKYRLYRSKGKMSTPLEHTDIMLSTHGDSQLTQSKIFSHQRMPRFREVDDTLQRFVDALSPDYIPISLIVDERMEIQHIIGDTSGLFRLPSGKPVNDLSKMVAKELSIPLSTSIQKVYRTHKTHVFSNIQVNRIDSISSFKMTVRPLPGRRNQASLVAVLIEEVKKEASAVEKPEVSHINLGNLSEQYVNDLEQELQFTRENLQATIEELETSNEELQATNEELLASNEELQSTNEELQSTNEELHTVNVEYQNKIIELTELNNDIENLLTSSQVGKLLLDANCEIRRFSKYVQNIIKILDSDIGRPLTHLTHDLMDVNLIENVKQVMDSKTTIEKEVQTYSGQWYFMRIIPYQISPDVFAGTILSFVEITKQKIALAELLEKKEQLEDTQKLSQIGTWELDLEKNELFWSDHVYDIFEIDKGKFTPSYDAFLNLIHPEDRPFVDKAYSDSVKNKEPYMALHRLLFKKGRIKYINEFGRTKYNKNGDPIRSIGIVQDVTQQQLIENRLSECTTRYQAIFNTTSCGLAVYRAVDDGNDFEVADLNSAAEIIESIRKDDLIGKRVSLTFPSLLDVLKRVWQTGEPEKYPVSVSTDGRISGFRENTVCKLETGEVATVYGAAKDIQNT